MLFENRQIDVFQPGCIVLLILVVNQVDFVDSVYCYSCVALNYRQRVLSPHDPLAPPQSRENLTELFNELTTLNIPHVNVSSSCADVALTSQPTFINAPRLYCPDVCAKIDFQFQGERVVLRNCLSKLVSISRKIKQSCQVPHENPTGISYGQFGNVSICQCYGDLCNSNLGRNSILALVLTFLSRVFI